MIKAVLTHYVSKTDVNGNRYFKVGVLSTITGKQKVFKSVHSSNSYTAIKKYLNLDYMSIQETEIQNLPINAFKNIQALDTLNKEDILELFKVDVKSKEPIEGQLMYDNTSDSYHVYDINGFDWSNLNPVFYKNGVPAMEDDFLLSGDL